ncbi:MAG: hypothetical protein LBM56_03880 [Burkholderiaceae bacterium]|nr:hypothetical protein [Burkholderiaceae bacterium]
MSVTSPVESPIINVNPIVNANPIINANPVVNANPIVSDNPVESPIIGGEAYNPDYDISCGCSASVPPGSRVTFMKFAAFSMAVGSVLVYGFFKLSQSMGWM